MASEVEICNRALSIIRAGSINSLDQTPATPQSQQCRLWYPQVRDMLLEENVWTFARKIVALALLEDVEVFGWRYVYQYPNDCLRVSRVIPNISSVEGFDSTMSPTAARLNDHDLYRIDERIPRVPYEIYNEGGVKVIVCNEPQARIDFRARITDPNRMSTQFTGALSALLASFIAVPLIGTSEGSKMRREALALYAEMMNMAATSNANERFSYEPESEYITVRY